MNIIYVLIPIAIILVLVAVGVFFWAVKNDQFEDLERQGYSILFDDDLPSANKKPDGQKRAASTETNNTINMNNKTDKNG